MSVDVVGLAAAGSAIAGQLMPDLGTVSRGSGPGTIDPVTGVYTPGAASVAYSGKCRVRKPNQIEQQTVFGDLSVTVIRYLVNVPFDAPLLQIGDVFVLGQTADHEIAGVPMRVTAVVAKSVLIYRQLGVEVIE